MNVDYALPLSPSRCSWVKDKNSVSSSFYFSIEYLKFTWSAVVWGFWKRSVSMAPRLFFPSPPSSFFFFFLTSILTSNKNKLATLNISSLLALQKRTEQLPWRLYLPPPPKWSICTIPGAMGINWLPRNGWPFHSWLRLIRIHRILCCCSVSVGPDSLFFWVAFFLFLSNGMVSNPNR